MQKQAMGADCIQHPATMDTDNGKYWTGAKIINKRRAKCSLCSCKLTQACSWYLLVFKMLWFKEILISAQLFFCTGVNHLFLLGRSKRSWTLVPGLHAVQCIHLLRIQSFAISMVFVRHLVVGKQNHRACRDLLVWRMESFSCKVCEGWWIELNPASDWSQVVFPSDQSWGWSCLRSL